MSIALENHCCLYWLFDAKSTVVYICDSLFELIVTWLLSFGGSLLYLVRTDFPYQHLLDRYGCSRSK